MKKMKSYTTMSVLFRVAFFLLISLSLFLYFGCEEEPEPEEDMSISEITIYNIPDKIPVSGGSGSNDTFKIYLNASNSQSETEAPVAKGVAKVGTPNNGKYSVTIKLQNPNSATDKNPNTDTGSWSGTANYFSVMISPKSLGGKGKSAVLIKAGSPLDKGKKECDWDKLIDFPATYEKKATALYNDIIVPDEDINKE